MKARILIVAALGLMAVAAAPPGKPATASDSDALQGTWCLAAVEVNKQTIPLENLKDGNTVLVGTLVVKGDNYTFHLGKSRLELTFRMDPSKTPRAIDLTVVEGQLKGQTYHGIYKLEGDTYTICRPTLPDKARPTEFATRPDSGLMLVVWKREKAATPPGPKK
jgi:RNA polymerase sigma-70 factor (ECF subfamily)